MKYCQKVVTLAVNKTYPSCQQKTSIRKIECLFVVVKFITYLLLVCAVYIPPGSNLSIYYCFADAVEEVLRGNKQYKMVVITDDFNQPTTEWLSPLLMGLNDSYLCIGRCYTCICRLLTIWLIKFCSIICICEKQKINQFKYQFLN